MTRTTYRSKVEFTALQNIADGDYWIDHLSGGWEKSTFPSGRPVQEKMPYTVGVSGFVISGALYLKLAKLSNRSLPRLQMILTAGLAALLNKYTGSSDILIGTPIYKQKVQAEFINTVLPLRNRINHRMTFKELVLQVREIITRANEHQNYPVELILQKLGIPYSKDDEFPLFDTAILLENLQDKSYIGHLKPNMLFSFLDTGENQCLEGVLEYNRSLYGEETVERIIRHYRQLLEIVLDDPDKPLLSLDILTAQEKRLLLEEYNNTRTGYPDSKTIDRLFREQVERTPGQIAVIDTGSQTGGTGQGEITYRELNRSSDEMANGLQDRGVGPDTIVGIMMERSRRLVIGILGILKAGGAYLPMDPENPVERIKYMLADSSAGILVTSPVLSQKFEKLSMAHCRLFMVNEMSPAGAFLGCGCHPPFEKSLTVPRAAGLDPAKLLKGNNLAYIIYTSGTTGKPKGVMIHHRGLVNYIWWAAKHYVEDTGTNFPLFTSLSFDLTVTSIFTPLITGNTLVVYGDENKDTLIERVLTDQRVKVVKITPSQLKTVMDKPIEHSAVRRFILGGEELETRLAGEITAHFPDCREVINEYGPTEAAVGCMRHRFEAGKDTGASVPLGVPADNVQIYILDKGLQPVPIGVTGEMYISGDGIARGYLNRPELTSEKFIKFEVKVKVKDKVKVKEKESLREQNPNRNMSYMSYKSYISPGFYIYRTGDLAKWLPGGKNMVYCGRSDQQLKIRGYRIEPGEIETRLTGFDGVKQGVVVPFRDNRGETQLAAYVVPGMTVKAKEYEPAKFKDELRYYLGEHLPYYMIPAHIEIIEAIPLTGSGKVDRKKLPGPLAGRNRKYTPPANRLEQDLVEIWSKVLRLEKSSIGVEDNFFEMGGHSLKATILVTDLHKQLNFRISLKEIFSMPTIRGLSEYLLTREKDNYIPIEPAVVKEYYELSSAQKRMYVAQQLEPQSTCYNICTAVILEGEPDLERFKKACRDLIKRHESLRTSFVMLKKEPVQRIHDEIEINIHYDEQTAQSPDNMINDFIRPFNLAATPLLRVGLVRLETRKYLLMVNMHHIISDGVSMVIFLREFSALYEGIELPTIPLQYKDYSEWQRYLMNSARLKEQEEFWLNNFKDNIPVLKLPFDYPQPLNRSFTGHVIHFEIGESLLVRLKELATAAEATLYMILLTVFIILMAKYSEQEDIVVGSPVTGRTHSDLQHIIGMFVNMLAMRNQPVPGKPFSQFLKEVNENALAAFENQEYPFDELVSRLGLKGNFTGNPLFRVVFAMQNMMDAETIYYFTESTGSLKLSPYSYDNHISKFDLLLVAVEDSTCIHMSLEYSTELFKKETADKITRYYTEILTAILNNNHIELKDINLSHGLMELNPDILDQDTEEFCF